MLNAIGILITGALGGQTALQTAINASAPYAAQTIGSTFGENGSNPNKAAQLFSHAVLGAVVAYTNGGDALGGALAGGGGEAAAMYLTKTLHPEAVRSDGTVDTSKLSEKAKENIRNLSSAVAAVGGGLAGGRLADVQTGGMVGRNAVENNYLTVQEVRSFKEEFKQCTKGDTECLDSIVDKYLAISADNRDKMKAACLQGNRGSSSACAQMEQDARDGLFYSLNNQTREELAQEMLEIAAAQNSGSNHLANGITPNTVEIPTVEVNGKAWWQRQGYDPKHIVTYENLADIAYLDKNRANADVIRKYLQENSFNHSSQPKSLLRPSDLLHWATETTPELDKSLPQKVAENTLHEKSNSFWNATLSEKVINAAYQPVVIAQGVDQAVIGIGEAVVSLWDLVKNTPELVNSIEKLSKDTDYRNQVTDALKEKGIQLVEQGGNYFINAKNAFIEGNIGDIREIQADFVSTALETIIGAKAGKAVAKTGKIATKTLDKVLEKAAEVCRGIHCEMKTPDGLSVPVSESRKLGEAPVSTGSSAKGGTSSHGENIGGAVGSGSVHMEIKRDHQGKARDEKGRYTPDPERLDTDLVRSSLRAETKQSIYSEYTRLADGSYMHKSGKIIKPPVHIGHAYSWENRRLLKAAEELGMTQRQLNDYVNDPSRTKLLFQLENATDNLSHRYEKPGIGDLQKIKDDMLDFLNSRNEK